MRNLPYGFDVCQVNVKTIRQIGQIFVAFSEKLNFKNLGLGPGQLWLMGPLIFPCCVFSLAYYILTAPRLRNVDGFILPILQKVVKIYIHDICNFFIRTKGQLISKCPLYGLLIVLKTL